MGGFVARRVFVTIPVVFCALSLLFLLFFLVPGDPVDTLAGGGGERAVSESVRRNIEEKYGFDDPVFDELSSAFETDIPDDRRPTFAGLLRLDHLFFRLPDGWQATTTRLEMPVVSSTTSRIDRPSTRSM